ncbi:3-ketoacyl-CoA synthase 6-like, partial [Triticum urartu]|uniref:3-ketoacyl-CoA synthase 6-like n=1 Tax=Triticum urartu TaxID=4572 RepID=UPI002043154F
LAVGGEPLRALWPIHLLMPIVLPTVAATVYLAYRPIATYLVDYACFRPSPNCRFPRAALLEHAHMSTFLADSTINFIARVLEHSGLSDETCVPPALSYIEPYCSLDEARAEVELVVFSVVDDLLAKTRIDLDTIDILVTNCSVFSPVPSIADMIVSRYKLRGDLRVINLSGMGCSATVTAVGLARNILEVMPFGSQALVVSTETIGPNHYAGNNRSMQLVNILFRMGGAAVLLSSSRSKARFRLTHVVRTITASDDNAYRCVYQEEDDEGIKGANLSKNLMAIAGDALKANITAMGPLVLPTSELIKFLLVSLARKVFLGRRIRPYIPNFRTAFKHFCIHVGGPAVISSVQRGLNLSDEHVEPSRMTLHQFGNQSSASVWYELGYIEAKGRMLKGNRVWMIGFGAGYECNSAVWVCIRTCTSHGDHGPWASCIHRYPLDVQK